MKHFLLTSTLATAALFALGSARADDFPTETFSGATASNGAHSTGTIIPGTALEVTAGYAWIANGDPTPGRGNYLDLASGWYSPNYSNATDIGSSTVRSTATFDLLAGYEYTFSFDYSRQTFSAGNGPFDTSLTAALGSHSVTYNDVAGFYYGFDWQTATLTWTQQTTELGARVSFTASGPAGYSGMNVDNIAMVGVAPTDPGVPTAPVPEPETWALMLGGLALVGHIARRRGLRGDKGEGA
ncbi:MAG: PEPxxWA-CTERM sorting domain-containing protein [Burkholderiaceae bacterium]